MKIQKAIIKLVKGVDEIETHEWNYRTNRYKTEKVKNYYIEINALSEHLREVENIVCEAFKKEDIWTSLNGDDGVEIKGIKYETTIVTLDADDYIDKEGRETYTEIKEKIKEFNKRA